MSERQPNPEKKRSLLNDNCDNCGEDYDLTPDNTTILHYQVDTHMDNLICHCPHCKYVTRMFIGPSTFEQAVKAGITLNDNKYASEAVVSDFEELRGMEPVETYQLTHRLEEVMGNAALIFNRTPDEHLYDLIVDTGYDKPHALRWND